MLKKNSIDFVGPKRILNYLKIRSIIREGGLGPIVQFSHHSANLQAYKKKKFLLNCACTYRRFSVLHAKT